MTTARPSTIVAAMLLVACQAEGPGGATTTTGESCQTECIDDEGSPPLACDGSCKRFQMCINNVCTPETLPECDTILVMTDTELDVATSEPGRPVLDVQAHRLGLGEADDLLLWYGDRVVVVSEAGVGTAFEILVDGGGAWPPVVGEFSGDGIPDFAVSTGLTIDVYAGDGAGGFELGQSIEQVGLATLAADLDANGEGDLVTQTNALLRLEVENGLLVERGEIAPLPVFVDFRVDGNDQPELWTATRDRVTAHRGSSLTASDVPIAIDEAEVDALLHGYYTGAPGSDAAALVSTSQGTFLLLGDMLEHAAHLELQSGTPARADLDGDGLDDILLGDFAILGLGDGTAGAPLAAACKAPLDLVQLGRRALARRAAGEPPYVVLWDQPAAPTPHLYVLEPQ